MNPLFETPIQSQNDAEDFLRQLHQMDMLFHPEDSPKNIITGPSGKPLFTAAEAKAVADRMDEVFQHLDDPCGFCLDIIAQDIADDDDRSNGPRR
jgi:hypothetical protein